MSFHRINHAIAALSQRSLVAGFLEFTDHRLANIVGGTCSLIGGQDRSFDAAVRYSFQDRRGNGSINTHATNADAKSRANVAVIASTLVSVSMTRSHAVGYPHHPAAMPASHQSGQQSSSTARRFS